MHDYLGTILDWTKKYLVKVDVRCYQESMSEEFPEEIAPNGKALWNDALFKVDDDSPSSNEQKSGTFHTFFYGRHVSS